MLAFSMSSPLNSFFYDFVALWLAFWPSDAHVKQT